MRDLFLGVWDRGQLRHPSITFWHHYKTHTTSESALTLSYINTTEKPDRDLLSPLVKSQKGKTVIQSSWCERLVLGCMGQPRHPSITLWHHYKTHTTSESQPWPSATSTLLSNLDRDLLSPWVKSQKGRKKDCDPKFLVWETCSWVYGCPIPQTTIHHPLTPLQDSHYTKIRPSH